MPSLIPLAGYFLLVAYWGHLACRRLRLEGATPLTLWPLALVMGLCAQLLLVNLISHLARPPVSFALALGLQALSALLMRGERLPAPAPAPRGAAALSALLGIAAAALGCAAFGVLQPDNLNEHGPNAATIAAGNFPVALSFHPSMKADYHYGTDLLAAQLLWLSGAPVAAALQFGKIAALAAAITLAFGMVYERQRSIGLAGLAAWLHSFYGGVGLAYGLLSRADSGAELWRKTLQLRYFSVPGNFFNASVGLQTVPMGRAVLLSIFYLLWRGGSPSLATGAALVALAAALAMVSTPDFGLLLIGWSAFLLYRSVRGGWRSLLPDWLCLASATALAALQGGMWAKLLQGGERGVSGQLSLRWPPGLMSVVDGERYAYHGRVHRIDSLDWLWQLLGTAELSLLIPVVLVLSWRQGRRELGVPACVVLAGLLLSHLVSHRVDEFNTLRLLAVAMQLNVLLAFLLAPRPARPRALGALWLAALLGSVPHLLWTYETFSRLARGERPIMFQFEYTEDPEAARLGAWIASVVPRGSRVATNEPKLVAGLAGRFAPSSDAMQHHVRNPEGLPVDYSRWTLESLDANQADYACLLRSPSFQRADIDPAGLREDLASRPRLRRFLLGQLASQAAFQKQMRVPARGADPEAFAQAARTGEIASAEVAAALLSELINRNWGLRPMLRAAGVESTPAAERLLLGPPPDRPPYGPPAAGWDRRRKWLSFRRFQADNRRLLQALLPRATRPSLRLSEDIGAANLARYPWYAMLERERGPRPRLEPPFQDELLYSSCVCLPLRRDLL